MRFMISLVVGLFVGLGMGVVLGWGPLAVEYVNSPASDLSPLYQDDYTVMIADGYQTDRDPIGAVERLRLLGVTNIPLHVQAVTERYISTSQSVDDIRSLVALSEALGHLTPIMEPYREVSLPEVSP